MASDSATALATQQSIKAYVDSKVATVDTLAEVLANGNTTGANNIIVTNGQKITTNTIDETTAAAGVTIDSVLLKDNAVTATTFNGTLNGAAPAGSLSGTTLASNVVSSSLTSVGTLANLTVTNPISGSVTGSSGSTTGNAATATALQTARNINGVSFNGTADITVTAAAGTLTGTTLASGVTASSLTSVGTLTSLTVSGTSTLNNTVTITGPNVGNTSLIVRNANSANSGEILLGGTTYGAKITRDSLGADQDLLIVNSHGGAQGFKFRTGSTTAGTTDLMVITGSGNLGVGTTSTGFNAAGLPLVVGSGTGNTGMTIYSGNASVGSIHFADAVTTGADSYRGYVNYNHSTNSMQFGTNAGDRATLDASGNLGLGVTPSAWGSIFNAMQLGSGIGTTFIGGRTDTSNSGFFGVNLFYNGTNWVRVGASNATRYYQADGQHTWDTSASSTAGSTISFTQAMTLDASGNLGVGATSPDIYSFGSGGKYLTLQNTASGGFSLVQIVSEGTTGGGVAFGNATIRRASIEGINGSHLAFYTNGTNSGTSVTERARITSTGAVLVNSTTTGGKLYVYNPATNFETNTIKAHDANASTTSDGVLIAIADRNTTNNTFYALGYYNAGAAAFKFRVADSGDVTNTNGSYTAISDAKLKQDIIDAPSQWDDIKATRFRKYRFKADVERLGDDAPYLLGVVAQELELTSPGCIDEHPDYEEQEVTDEDGNVTTERVKVGSTKSFKQSVYLMKAAVALQEAMARIEALEARLEALEA